MDLFGEDIQEEPPAAVPQEDSFDEASEIDTGLQHPRYMQICLGHTAQEQKLIQLAQGGQMPHALVLSGPKGIGKATMAYRLARFMFKRGLADPAQDALFDAPKPMPETLEISSEDGVFKRIASGGHPDFMSVERAYDATKNKYKSGVDIEEIRKIEPFLRRTAAEGGWRIVIVDDADTMNTNAQNALLKILEEPPKNVLLILVVHRMGALIPTIRSRVQIVNFTPLTAADVQSLLALNGLEYTAQEFDVLYNLCGGSIGRALSYIEEGGLESLGQILEVFESYPHWPWPRIHMLAEELARKGNENAYDGFAALFEWLMSELLTTKARGREINSAALQKPALQTLLKKTPLDQLVKICDNLQSHFARINKANLDKRQGVLGAFEIITA